MYGRVGAGGAVAAGGMLATGQSVVAVLIAGTAVAVLAGIALADGKSWWQRLNGMSGTEGRDFLAAIIAQLEADPERFRAMNPPNGWGCYDGPDGLLGVLRKMRDSVPEGEASVWHVSG